MKEPSCSKNMEKVCMNENCGVALPSPADCGKGWPLRSAGFATLCRKCGAAYEQLVFCELFHAQDSGWRECISCSKRLHCGCAASTSLLELLDSGGVICISCSENRELCSDSGLGNNKDAEVYAVGENQLTSSANQSNIGIIKKMNLVQCGETDDVTKSLEQTNVRENSLPSPGDLGSPLLSFFNQQTLEAKQSEKPSERKENTLSRDVHESLLQTNLTISLSATSGNTNLSHTAVVEERSAGVNIPSISLGSKSRHPLPRPLKSIMAAGLETSAGTVAQLRVARPPVEGRIKNQLLPRYWPRITDQELQKIAGDSKSTVVPLFEKVLSASDAGRIGRLVLPKACAEAYFPPISQPEGLPLRIQDIKGKEWVFQFRFWPNNNSRMYVLEGVTPCIQSMQLQAGDTVTFSRMDPEGKLLMGFRKASNSIFMQDNKHLSSTHKGSFSIEPMTMPVNGQPGCHQLLKGSSALPRQFSSGDFGYHVGEMNDWKGPASSPLSIAERKKNRNIGSKSKRLLMDSDDALELKLSWEELQNMLCPPPSVEPTTVTIEDYEFEEYDEPPVFPKKSIFTIRPSGEQEQWAQCDSCLKWRSLPVHVILPPRWTCEDNAWSSSRPSCSVKDDLSPEELENLLRMTIELKKQRIAAGLDSGHVCESSKPDGSRNPAADGGDTSEMDAASVKTTTRHPRHRPGCSCIVCIQPPSGKGKHKPTCTCNVCMTVKRRFKTLMMRRKKRQSEREAEVAQRNNLTWVPKEEAEVESFQPALGDHRRSQNTSKQPEKGQLDLNYHPDVELNSSRVSMIKLVREASLPLDNYLKQRGLASLVSDQQETARESQERCAGGETVQVQGDDIKDELPAGSNTS